MIVLDTNVISELMRQLPDPSVAAWVEDQVPDSLWTTSVSVFEIIHGIELQPAGKRRTELRKAFEIAMQDVFKSRIESFDFLAANESAMIGGRRSKAGLGSEIRDLQIAGIVASKQATLATRNVKDFANAGFPVIDPWSL